MGTTNDDQTMLKTLQVLRRTTDEHITAVRRFVSQLRRVQGRGVATKSSQCALCVQILAKASVVWISEWRSRSQPETSSLPVASDAEWVGVAEGPLFVCSRSRAPHYAVFVKSRSQTAGASPSRQGSFIGRHCAVVSRHRPSVVRQGTHAPGVGKQLERPDHQVQRWLFFDLRTLIFRLCP